MTISRVLAASDSRARTASMFIMYSEGGKYFDLVEGGHQVHGSENLVKLKSSICHRMLPKPTSCQGHYKPLLFSEAQGCGGHQRIDRPSWT